MRTDISCSHGVFNGARFEDPSSITLELRNSFSNAAHLIIEYEEKQRDIPDKTSDINSIAHIPHEFAFIGANFTVSSFIVELFDFFARIIQESRKDTNKRKRALV